MKIINGTKQKIAVIKKAAKKTQGPSGPSLETFIWTRTEVDD